MASTFPAVALARAGFFPYERYCARHQIERLSLRDETQFPDADRFVPGRTPNRHLAFGHGIHFCLGASLARLEAKIALSLLLQRFRELRRVAHVPLEPLENPVVYGVKHVPMTFQPC